jgi:hypothetical protein
VVGGDDRQARADAASDVVSVLVNGPKAPTPVLAVLVGLLRKGRRR